MSLQIVTVKEIEKTIEKQKIRVHQWPTHKLILKSYWFICRH